jgi:hypothetical protein
MLQVVWDFSWTKIMGVARALACHFLFFSLLEYRP